MNLTFDFPENPPPLSKELQAQNSMNPVRMLEKTDLKDMSAKPAIKEHKLKTHETVHVKQLATRELSFEQQFYFKEITEACFGADEDRRAEASQSLVCVPGIYEMLPRMSTFKADLIAIATQNTNQQKSVHNW
jgi:transcription initiation factor TFIID subunit 6